MAARRGWYRAKEFAEAFEERELPDGSKVKNEPFPTSPLGIKHRLPALLLTRTYPWGFVQTIEHIPPSVSPHNERVYGEITPGPEAHSAVRRSLDEQMADPDWKAPMSVTSTNAIPGNRPNDHFDEATQMYFDNREAFDEYYRKNKLEKLMQTDVKNYHMPKAKEMSGKTKFDFFDSNRHPDAPIFQPAKLPNPLD